SACATPPAPRAVSDLATTEAPNQVRVSVATASHVVRFAPRSDALEAGQVAGLNTFLADQRVTRDSTLVVEHSALPADAERGAILAGALAERGYRPQIRVAELAPGDVRLTVETYVAEVPDCPNWSKPPGNDPANTLHSDFGCATAKNLAAMVADPRDLVAPREMGPPVGDPAVAGVDRYRHDRVEPLGAGVQGPSTPPTPPPPAVPGPQ
ncbi:MAG: hypothetical protein JOZ27_08285, partial [Caulobacteraceae bacterium]|nr:hypothetical protein [Caulobacteraceae bacterium]